MVKKAAKRKNGLTIEIDQTVVDALGITQKTDLMMVVMDDMLIIKARDKKSSQKRKDRLKDRTNRLMDQYESVLKKLAHT